VAADFLGNLYNKEDIIQYLLEKKPQKEFEHIRKLKDIINLNMTPRKNESQSKLGSVADAYEGDTSVFMCPITSLPMSGRHRFAFLSTCGCVLSEKALKEVPTTTCLSVGVFLLFFSFLEAMMLLLWLVTHVIFLLLLNSAGRISPRRMSLPFMVTRQKFRS